MRRMKAIELGFDENQVIVSEGNCVKGKERVMFLAPLTKIFQLQFCRHRSLSPWIYTDTTDSSRQDLCKRNYDYDQSLE